MEAVQAFKAWNEGEGRLLFTSPFEWIDNGPDCLLARMDEYTFSALVSDPSESGVTMLRVTARSGRPIPFELHWPVLDFLNQVNDLEDSLFMSGRTLALDLADGGAFEWLRVDQVIYAHEFSEDMVTILVFRANDVRVLSGCIRLMAEDGADAARAVAAYRRNRAGS